MATEQQPPAVTPAAEQVPFPTTPPLTRGGATPFTRRPAKPLPTKPRADGTARPKVLLLYTGGTIGMRKDNATGAYIPDVAFLEDSLMKGSLLPDDESMPELAFSALDPPLDSSDMNQLHWEAISRAIGEEYERYDGFVVIHGTDTMAYSASAASFALEGLSKPVVFTGSQIPLCAIRSDGLTNLTDSCLVAAHGGSALAEVCVVFDNLVLRGNRTTKLKAWGISGFKSFNYPPLGEGGVHLVLFENRSKSADPKAVFRCRPKFSNDVAVLSVFPGIERFAGPMVKSLVDGGVRGIVLEAFGIGNAPGYDEFSAAISDACAKGAVVVVVSRCPCGSVALGSYSGGYGLGLAGCVSGYDMTTEAAFSKLSWLLADKSLSVADVRRMCEEDLRGEAQQGFLVHHNRNHRILV